MPERLTRRDLFTKNLRIAFKDAPCGCDSCGRDSQPSDAAAREAVKFAHIVAQAAVPAGRELPARFNAAVEFAQQRFAIGSDDAPSIKLVASSALPPGATGQYLRDHNTIIVLAGLTDAETRATVWHEFTHAYERLKNWTTDEGFAEYMERELDDQWNAQERGW